MPRMPIRLVLAPLAVAALTSAGCGSGNQDYNPPARAAGVVDAKLLEKAWTAPEARPEVFQIVLCGVAPSAEAAVQKRDRDKNGDLSDSIRRRLMKILRDNEKSFLPEKVGAQGALPFCDQLAVAAGSAAAVAKEARSETVALDDAHQAAYALYELPHAELIKAMEPAITKLVAEPEGQAKLREQLTPLVAQMDSGIAGGDGEYVRKK